MRTHTGENRWAEYFKLKEADRETFILNPERDYKLYVDLDNVLGLLNKGPVRANLLKLVVQGDFGTGKTHLLRYLEHAPPVNDPEQVRPIFVKLGGLRRQALFIDFFQQIMRNLLPVLEEDCRASLGNQSPDVSELPNDDLRRAMGYLLAPVAVVEKRPQRQLGLGLSPAAPAEPVLPPTVPSERLLARRWLSASPDLKMAESLKGGYGERLVNETPSRLVTFLLSLARFYHLHTNRTLLLLLDESESFSRLADRDAQDNMAEGIRELFDPTNDALGIVVGLTTPSTRAGLHPMLRSDVRSRMTGKLLTLRPLADEDRIKRFVEQLWKKLTRDPELPPFQLGEQGFKYLVSAVKTWRLDYDPNVRESHPVVHRDVIHVLEGIAKLALWEGAHPPIREEQLSRWRGNYR